MARRQSSQRFSRQVSRPNRTWAGDISATFVNLAASSKVLAATIVLSNQGIDETILRVVGGIAVGSDQTGATEFQQGAIGMCLVTDTAAGVGIGSLPDPVTDIADDIWFMYQSWHRKFQFADATGTLGDAVQWYPFDSRAKRIIHSGEQVAVVVANANSSFGFEFALTIRVLTQVRGTR